MASLFEAIFYFVLHLLVYHFALAIGKPTPFVEVATRTYGVNVEQMLIFVRAMRVFVHDGCFGEEYGAEFGVHASTQIHIFHVEEESLVEQSDLF